MTPQEAVANLVSGGLLKGCETDVLDSIRTLMGIVASTAHDNEMRRCADLVRFTYGTEIAKHILRTGGLKVDNEHPQTSIPG